MKNFLAMLLFVFPSLFIGGEEVKIQPFTKFELLRVFEYNRNTFGIFEGIGLYHQHFEVKPMLGVILENGDGQLAMKVSVEIKY